MKKGKYREKARKNFENKLTQKNRGSLQIGRKIGCIQNKIFIDRFNNNNNSFLLSYHKTHCMTKSYR